MKSYLDPEFLRLYRELPEPVRRHAGKCYELWRSDHTHPSLNFKRIGLSIEAYSVRVGRGWRAVGIKSDDSIIWFWIGSHADYDRLLKSL